MSRQPFGVLFGTIVATGVGVGSVGLVRVPPALDQYALAVTIVLVALGGVYYRTVRGVRQQYPSEPITPASWITITRGAMIPALGGFILVPAATGWLPGLLFALAAGLDAVDGIVARRTGTVTELGGALDGATDGLVVLVGAAVAVAIEAAPPAFLLAGIALYLFDAGRWYRRRRGLPVYELPPSQRRRAVGAGTMLVIFIALSPIVSDPTSRTLAWITLGPLCGSFLWDWLAVVGRR
ncbi:CDP-alcohol phosphatidyltransferase family protein [Halalkalirubrum salinum]|uniref:CDP-alcohol phosphatidyltransferase family protein n=1 Tax=Halalkalirubrum salinum TaxID=2563889 RepID=UPI0010FAFAAA|nr:CDP-alcohol phosphatidyltransferase family protein [Halalkalirubrum salinum]